MIEPLEVLNICDYGDENDDSVKAEVAKIVALYGDGVKGPLMAWSISRSSDKAGRKRE